MLTANIKASVASTLSANVDAAANSLSGNIVWTPLGARGVGIASIQKTAAEGLVDTYTVTYTDGATYRYQVRNGETGKNGVTFTPHMAEDGTLSWTNDAGLENPAPMNLEGYSPKVELTETETGVTVTVTNKDGKQSVQIPAAKFETDETLTLEGGILSVNRAEKVEEDNTLPITSAAVYAEVGNINALLATI